jgi:hypothetical protein
VATKKIVEKGGAFFAAGKFDGFRTTFTTHFTTFSPSKHHTEKALFLKHPTKTPHKNTSKNNKTPERFSRLRGLIFF